MRRLAALVLTLVPSAAFGAEPPPAPADLSLAQAVRSALEKNNALVVERQNVVQADAAVSGARGAYDLFWTADGRYRDHTDPINSAFSGAPDGDLAPTLTDATISTSFSQLLPTGGTLGLSTGWARDTTNSVFTPISPAYGTFAGISLRQPLLRDLSIDPAREAIRIAVAQRGQTEAQLRASVADTVTRVDAVYWTLVAARRNVASIKSSVELAERQLQETKSRVEAGVLGETDIAQPTAERERRMGNLALAQQAVVLAETQLKQLILADASDPLWGAEIRPTDDPDAVFDQPELDAALASARLKRPELAAAEARRTVAEVVVAARRSDILPRLDVVAAYARNGLAGGPNPDAEGFNGQPVVVPPPLLGASGRSYGTITDNLFPDYTVGLAFSVPIQNRTAKANLAISRSQLEQSIVDVQSTGQQVEAEVRNAFSALQTQRQRVLAARSGLEAAQTQLYAEQERFAVGLSTNFLVLTRQNELTQAAVTETDALTDYRRAATELARATGVLLERRNIMVGGARRAGGGKLPLKRARPRRPGRAFGLTALAAAGAAAVGIRALDRLAAGVRRRARGRAPRPRARFAAVEGRPLPEPHGDDHRGAAPAVRDVPAPGHGRRGSLSDAPDPGRAGRPRGLRHSAGVGPAGDVDRPCHRARRDRRRPGPHGSGLERAGVSVRLHRTEPFLRAAPGDRRPAADRRGRHLARPLRPSRHEDRSRRSPRAARGSSCRSESGRAWKDGVFRRGGSRSSTGTRRAPSARRP